MNSRYIIAIPALFIIALFSSCSIFSKKVKKEAVLPTDRQQISVKAALKTFTPEEIRNGVVKGDWAIEKVEGKEVAGREAPYIKFDTTNKKIYGNNGCNVINGDYLYNPADSTISFSNVISTMRDCPDAGITDREINLALNATQYYTWEAVDSDYYLYFYNRDHKLLLTLMHQNFEFLNGTWRVAAIEGTPVNVPDMKLVIDVDEGRIHGNTGCNILNGAMEIDMYHPNSISFQAIFTTKMACKEPNYETTLIVALEDAMAAKPISNSEVLFFDHDHKEVLRLIRTSETD